MSDTRNPPVQIPVPEAIGGLRLRLRQDRQARVGILRNPNQPPKPPTRRAALMGKWPSLRSSRRPSAPHPAFRTGDQPVVAAPSRPVAAERGAESPVVLTASGQAPRIDIAGLMASVDGIADSRPVRTPFAAEFRHDVPCHGRPAGSCTRPSVLSAEAWLDEDEDDDEDGAERCAPASAGPETADARVRRGLGRRLLRGAVLAAAGLGLAVAMLIVLAGLLA